MEAAWAEGQDTTSESHTVNRVKENGWVEEAAKGEGSAQQLQAEGEEAVGGGGLGGYLCESKRVGHWADEDLTQFSV